MTPAAPIFDMDGVLLNSTTAHESAFKTVLEKYRLKTWSYDAIAGMHTKTAFEKIFKENDLKLSEKELEFLIFEKRKLAFEALEKLEPIEPDAAEVLLSLSREYKLALASSASRRLVDWFCSHSKTTDLFSTILCGDEVKDAKTCPNIYLLAAERLTLEPEECLVIEDAESGIEAAFRAGIPVCVKLGTLKDIPKTDKRVQKTFRTLTDLLDLL